MKSIAKFTLILTALVCLASSSASCASVMAETGNSISGKMKRKKMCAELCKKQHYPDVKFIRSDGALETYKIHIVSIDERTVCECKF